MEQNDVQVGHGGPLGNDGICLDGHTTPISQQKESESQRSLVFRLDSDAVCWLDTVGYFARLTQLMCSPYIDG